MDVLLDVGGRCGVRCFVLVWLLVVKVSANCPQPQENDTLALTLNVLSKTYVPLVTYDIFKCAPGHFTKSGNGSVTCQDDDTWSETTLQCEKKDCGPPDPMPHVRFDTSAGTLFDDLAQMTCDKGYRMSGIGYKRCLATGWDGKSNCVIITCEIPPMVAHRSHSWVSEDEPKYGEKIMFSCDNEYTMIGQTTNLCGDDGEYDAQPPDCIDMNCDIPPAVANGRSSWVSEDEPSNGEMIRFSCDKGFTLIGASSIMCMIGGQYDSPPPECKDKPTTDKQYVVITVKDILLCLFGVAFVFLLFLYICLYRRKSSVNGTAPLC